MRPLVSQGAASLRGAAGWEKAATAKGIKLGEVHHHQDNVFKTRSFLHQDEATTLSCSCTLLARVDAGVISKKGSCSRVGSQAVCKASTVDGVGGSQIAVNAAGALAAEEDLAEGMCVSMPINFYEVSGWRASCLSSYPTSRGSKNQPRPCLRST